MTERPAAFRYFAWLARLEMKEKPSAVRMLMKRDATEDITEKCLSPKSGLQCCIAVVRAF